MGPAKFDEIVLKVKSPEEGTPILGRRTLPIRGYAKYLLGSLQESSDRPKLLSIAAQKELANYAAAFALKTAQEARNVATQLKDKILIDCGKDSLSVNSNQVLQAARVAVHEFFDDDQIDFVFKLMRDFEPCKIKPPSSLAHLDIANEEARLDWVRLRATTLTLARVILTLGAIGDLSCCGECTIGDALLVREPFIHIWPSERRMGCETWFEFFCALLRGHKDYDQLSLLELEEEESLRSHHGWSAYVDTIGADDPSGCRKGRFWVQQGVPMYNGIATRCVMDAPSNYRAQAKPIRVTELDVSQIGTRQNAVCSDHAETVKPFMSTSSESWKLNARFTQGAPNDPLLSVGYKTLSLKLGIFRVPDCPHVSDPFHTPAFSLSAGVALARGFRFEKEGGPRVLVAQTYGCSAARWLALTASEPLSGRGRTIFIRHSSVCVSCFVAHACRADDHGLGIYLIL